MPHQIFEGCRTGQRIRPSERLSQQIYRSEIAPNPFTFHRLADRFGLPPVVAAVLADLAYPAVVSWRVRA